MSNLGYRVIASLLILGCIFFIFAGYVVHQNKATYSPVQIQCLQRAQSSYANLMENDGTPAGLQQFTALVCS